MMRSVWVSMSSDPFSVSTPFPRPSRRPTPGYLATESPSATDSETTQRRIEKAKRFGERHVQPLATATSALGHRRTTTPVVRLVGGTSNSRHCSLSRLLHNPAVPVFPKAYVMQKIRAKVSALFSWPAAVPAFTDHHSSGNLFFMVSIRVSMTRSRLS
jgi:hypothetical protein